MVPSHTEPDLTQQKKALRVEIVARRDGLDADLRRRGSRSIVEHLFLLIRQREATVVMAYVSVFSEVDTGLLLSELLSTGVQLILPKVNRRERCLDLYRVKHLGQDLAPGTWEIPEPIPERCERLVDTQGIDLVVVPGVAFTRAGHRLGYGGGFYDRLLGNWAGKRCFVAPAFNEQVVEALPCDTHDMRVHSVITPDGEITCL